MESGGEIKQQDKFGFRRCEPWQYCQGNGGPAAAWHRQLGTVGTVARCDPGWRGLMPWRGCAFPSGNQQRPWEDAVEAGGRVRERGSCGTRESPEQDAASCASPVPPMCAVPVLLPAWLLLDGAHRPRGSPVMLLGSRGSPLGKNTGPRAVLGFLKSATQTSVVSHPNQTCPVFCSLPWASTHRLLPGHSSS